MKYRKKYTIYRNKLYKGVVEYVSNYTRRKKINKRTESKIMEKISF